MTRKYSIIADILERRPRPSVPPAVPAVGDVFVRRPEYGPLEYAQVIGGYEEEARIAHVKFRLYFGYQDKTAELVEQTLAADLFGRWFPRMVQPETNTTTAEAGTPA